MNEDSDEHLRNFKEVHQIERNLIDYSQLIEKSEELVEIEIDVLVFVLNQLFGVHSV